jgi:hypothetical protein
MKIPKDLSQLKIPLHRNQSVVFNSPARFRVLVAGRRFGKTYLALAEMLSAAMGKDRLIWYVGPNDHQSKRIAWERLKRLTRRFWAKPARETSLRIDLTWGSTIVVNGAFNPDALRGDGLDFLVLDEFASMQPEAWAEVFRPALADRLGRALFIGTPKGRNHFYDRFEYAKTDPDWAAFHFTTAQGGIVSRAELHSAARELDPHSYRQEFEADFTSVTRNRVYYTFDRSIHLAPLTLSPLYPIVWAIDFNVNPMCMLLIQRLNDIVYVLDEIIIQPDANTEAACQAFHQRVARLYELLPMHQRPLIVEVYGDASGHQRRTSGAATDWAIIRQFFTGWKGHYNPSIRALSANPPIRDRVNCVNSRLRNTLSEARLFIDPRCRELIRDLEQVSWALDSSGATTSELDKSDRARTHASDALGYFISQAFPLHPLIGHQSSGRLF